MGKNGPAPGPPAALSPLHSKYFGHLVLSWLIRKDPDAGKDWGQEEKEQRMRWLGDIADSIDIEFGQTPGDGEGSRSLECYSP